MVKAVAAVAYGGPEVIEVIDVESRAPGPGEVTIEVRAAALNPSDLKTAQGQWGDDPAKLPRRLGAEAAGIVTAVGEQPQGLEGELLAIGDEVYGHRLAGAQAGELTVAADQLLRRPASASFGQASGLLLVGTTAVHALEAVGVGAGDVVLLHGASGGVGRIASQLALQRGARVIGTASAARHDDLRRLGVEPVQYGAGLADRVRGLAPDGVDAAIDTVGTLEALEVSLELLHDHARLVTISNFGPVLAAGGKAIGGGPGADPGREIRAAARLELARLLREGRLDVEVAREFPLDRAREAYEYLATGHPGGKVVLVP